MSREWPKQHNTQKTRKYYYYCYDIHIPNTIPPHTFPFEYSQKNKFLDCCCYCHFCPTTIKYYPMWLEFLISHYFPLLWLLVSLCYSVVTFLSHFPSQILTHSLYTLLYLFNIIPPVLFPVSPQIIQKRKKSNNKWSKWLFRKMIHLSIKPGDKKIGMMAYVQHHMLLPLSWWWPQIALLKIIIYIIIVSIAITKNVTDKYTFSLKVNILKRFLSSLPKKMPLQISHGMRPIVPEST